MAKKKNLLQSMEEDRRNRRTFRQAMAKELTGNTKVPFWSFPCCGILVIVSLVRQIMRGSYESAFFCLLALCLLYLPSWLQVKLRIELPPPLEITILLLHLRRRNPGGGQRLLRGGPRLGHHAPHPQRLSGRGGGLLHGDPAQRQ